MKKEEYKRNKIILSAMVFFVLGVSLAIILANSGITGNPVFNIGNKTHIINPTSEKIIPQSQTPVMQNYNLPSEKNLLFNNFSVYNSTSKDPKFNGYIIQFKEPSLIEYEQQLKNQKGLSTEQIELQKVQYKNSLISKQTEFKNKISSILPKTKMSSQFQIVFNGVTIKEISENDLEKIKQMPEVKSVSPNYEVKAFLNESIPLINADDVWKIQIPVLPQPNAKFVTKENITGKRIKIAIIDTGIDYIHPDLGGCFGYGCKVEGGYDFVNNDNDPMDDMGHGTHCASIAAGTGIASQGKFKGVAPDAKLYAYKVLNSDGSGWDEWIIEGIERAVTDNVDVISMSLGGYGNPDDSMSQAIDNAVHSGITCVIAAGNSGPRERTIGSPGTARKAITVGASDKQDQIASFSSRGPTSILTIKPDIVAPGVDICAARGANAWPDRLCYGNDYVSISGTSMATPMVAGTAALLKQKNPTWSPDEIKMALRNTAIKLIDPSTNQPDGILTQGYGRIDALALIQSSKPPIAEILTSGNVGGTINISGSAFGYNFDYYVLYYGHTDAPNQWTQLISSNRSIINNTLFNNFDTTYLLEGEKYALKLLVYDKQGRFSEDRILILPTNSALNSPGISQSYSDNLFFGYHYYSSMTEYIKNTFIGGVESIPINGTILIGGGISGYNINYANENNLNNWSDEGITLTNNSGKDIILGYWSNIQNLEEGNYLLKFTVFHAGNISSNMTNMLTISKSQHPGWPLYYTPEKIAPGTFVTLDDVNQDIPGDELVIGTMGFYPNSHSPLSPISQLSIRDHNGDLLNGWPVNISFSSWTFPSVGDINGDSNKEIVIASGRGFPERQNSRIYAFDRYGNLLNGWPVNISNQTPFQTTLADLNKDGKLEIIVPSVFDNYSSYSGGWSPDGYLHVLDYNGNELEGYPKIFNEHFFSSVAVGDVDNDGNEEIVVTAFGSFGGSNILDNTLIYVFKNDGSIMAGWPRSLRDLDNNYTLDEGERIFGLINTPPTLADLDNDDDLEIIFSIRNKIFVLDHNGDMLEGWPQTIDQILTTSAVIGDLDPNYPGPEIVFGSNHGYEYPAHGTKIYVFHSDGSSIGGGWPREICNSINWTIYAVTSVQPILFDVNNDGYNEIVSTCILSGFTTNNNIYAIDRYGNILNGWPKKTVFGSLFDYAPSGFALGDADNDNKLELIIGADNWYAGYSIHFWDLNATKDVNKPWPMFMHDAQHTGNYNFIQQTCIDSDGGKNYFVRGTTDGYSPTGIHYVETDYCSANPSILIEFFCNSNNYFDSETKNCPNGCSNGTCNRFPRPQPLAKD